MLAGLRLQYFRTWTSNLSEELANESVSECVLFFFLTLTTTSYASINPDATFMIIHRPFRQWGFSIWRTPPKALSPQ